MAGACGAGERGLTQPSPQAVLVHDSLNPPDNRASRDLVHSYEHPYTFPYFEGRAYDDFTSAVTTTIRTVSWQGGYCGGPLVLPLGTPQPPPVAAASSFEVVFYRDDTNGRPAWYSTPLYEVTFTPADAHEQFTFDSGSTGNRCTVYPPTATYYDYTAVLPTPFPVTAGTRYWLLVRAIPRTTGIVWGWRLGQQDNNYAVSWGQSLDTGPFDLAFRLSDQ